MAMMMDIPNVAATSSNAPVSKKGAVKAQKEGFQGTLKEQTRKQAQETAEKPQSEQVDASPADAVLQSGSAAAETKEEPVLSAGEEVPQDGKENLAVAVSPAAGNEPAICSSAASAGESVANPLSTTGNEAPADKRSGNAPVIAEATTEPKPGKSGANLSEQAVPPGKTAPPATKAPEQIAVPGKASQAGSSASRAESNANNLHGNPPAVATAGSEIARQQTAAQQTVIQQSAEGHPDQSVTKSAQSGLLEASFAGILQTPGPKGQSSTGNKPLRAADGTADVAVKVGEAETLPAAKLMVAEGKERNFSEAMLEKAAKLPDALETGKGPTPGQNGSVFESTLVSSTPGNQGQGQTSPLQSTFSANTPSHFSSFNEEVRILDQVMMKLPLGRTGGNDRIVIKLYPEELGEVKMDLVKEKDHLKVHLFAQSQQVQEVLEKHLPRLQEALQNQGIEFDEIRVSVESQSNQGQGFQEQNQQAPSFARNGHSGTPQQAGLAMAAASSRSGQGGLSLRV